MNVCDDSTSTWEIESVNWIFRLFICNSIARYVDGYYCTGQKAYERSIALGEK